MARVPLLVFVVLGVFLLARAVPVIDGPDPRTVNLDENSAIGSEVLTVTATDDDGGTFTFHIDPPSSIVDIPNSSSGLVTFAISPDREANPDPYLFTVVLRDTDGNDQDSITVSLQLMDVNDSPPVWMNEPEAPLQVSESVAVGTLLFYPEVTDDDIGSNDDIRFTLTSPLDGTFNVNPLFGSITINSPLNFDTTPAYTITVTAEDQGVPAMSTEISLEVNVVFELDPAPSFSQTQFAVTIDEGLYATPTNVFTVTALDLDDVFATIVYRQVMRGVPSDDLFEVNPMTGVISAVAELDREQVDFYTVDIQAYKVLPSNMSLARSGIATTRVVFTLADINDSPPVWDNPPAGSIDLPEDTSPGTLIYTIFATDADEGVNAALSYAVTSPTDGTYSVLAGNVFLTGAIDADVTPTQNVRITITDGGIPQNSIDATLMLTIIDVIDPPPVFTEEVYSVEQAEGDFSTSLDIIQLAVTEAPPVGDAIRYSLVPRGDASDTLFSVNPQTGLVTFTGILDREQTALYTLRAQAVIVDAIDSTVQSAPGDAIVVITVTDVNDNPPMFFTNHYFGSVAENARIGDIVVAGVSAFDIDEGIAAFEFGFADNTISIPFAIDSATGVITVAGILDFEMMQSYTFEIRVFETVLTGDLQSVASVQINIINVNDHAPMFAEDQYEFSIPEEQAAQVVTTTMPAGLTMIQATDGDSGVFGELTYSLLGTEVGTLFSVSGSSGEISTLAPLDREVRDIYFFTLIARDGGASPLQGATLIVIRVTDINDERPTFDPNAFTALLVEHVGYPNFLTVRATDGDMMGTPNSQIQYSIQFSNGSDVSTNFNIDSISGAISAQNLDRETLDSFSLRILATDMGTPALTGTATLDVTIQDTNDNSPLFMQIVYSVTLDEDHAVGDPIGVTVIATDPEGHAIQYRSESADADSAFFLVDASSGAIRLGHALDYDPPNMNRALSFRVLAVDDGSPALTGTATVMVNVNNVNDNTPIISDLMSTEFSIAEGNGTSVPMTFVSISATDLDGDPLTYSIEPPSMFFSITSAGDVRHVMQLDRLTAETHSLDVRACDGQGADERCDSVALQVTVTDYNNFAPMFTTLTASTTLPECDATDHRPLTTLTATDTSDLPPNSQIEYTAASGDTTSLMLNPDTGEISIAPGANIDFEGTTTYTLVVRATDNPGGTPRLSAPMDATFTLTITDCNDFPPVFDRGTSGYAFTLPERTTAPGSDEVVFGGITVTDDDGTAPNRIQNYQLLNGVDSTNGWFDINPNTGDIFIRSGEIIDRESSFVQVNSDGEGVIFFAVLVTNSATTGTLSATTTVTATITDINDNSPVIDQPDPLSVTIIEHARNGSIVTVITASDRDAGVNEVVSFAITAGNEAGNFRIDPMTGVVTITGDLDEEGDNLITLTVTASNSMALTSVPPDTITIMVSVIESNDNNPVFQQESYTASVSEFDALLGTSAHTVGEAVATVFATDEDGPETAAGRIEYSIFSGNFLGSVQIFDIPIPSQGVVTLLRPDLINFESQQQFDLVLIANDLVLPENERGQGSTHLVITVTDENDNTPMFIDMVYTGTVRETLPSGSSVTVSPTIRAMDDDQNGAEQLAFSFASGAPFTISDDGLLVETTAELDRETTSFYVITLQVTDTAGHIATAILNISVEDFNDNAPVFLQTPADLDIEIPENLALFGEPESSVIRTVQATDADIDDNAVFIFTLSGDIGYFDIGVESGDIILTQSLNRELIREYMLTVTATDAGLPTLSSSITFVVTIANINDNNPVFTMPVFEGTISEDAIVGVETGVVVLATDLDQDSVVTYSLVPGTTNLFDVQPTGIVFTSGLLDRETRDLHTFMVRATDGFRNSTDNALVEITVLDANDEVPIFEEPNYAANVSELTPLNAIILIVHANDNDIGTNAEVEYTITSVDPQTSTGFFGLGSESGVIFTNQEVIINPNDPTTITLTVRATDRGPFSNFAEVSVVMNLVDRNLNAPQFDQPHYNLSVAENQANSLVGIVRATEPTGDLNQAIEYVILLTTRDGVDNFRIDNQTGSIFTLSGLDREERDLFTFSLAAQDNGGSGQLSRTGYATVTVYVLDVNDNDPVFDPDSYPIAISESTGANSTLIRLTAFDNDIGSNSQLTYQIASGDSNVFAIDNSGVLTTRLPLDRETVPSYFLVVTARDSGAGSRQGMANVSITINDENDNSPVFTGGAVIGSGVVSVDEDSPPGTPITVVQATDEDFQLNRIVVYTFPNSTLASGPFVINSATGEIVLQSSLDREEQGLYELTVLASDQRGIGPEVRTTIGTFTVVVEDVNDNFPQFNDPLYEFEISEAFALNTVFGQIEASDADTGSNAVIYYHIIGDSTENTTCSNQFCVNLETGELFLVGSLDRETRENHLITVGASNDEVLRFNETTGAPIDTGTGSASIIVTDANDQQPVFIESTLLAVIAEEAPFGTTITTLQANDADTLNGSIVWYEIATPQVPYLVDRDTGIVTTAGVFRGLTGTRYSIEVRAFDNFGIPPSFSTSGTMEVLVFKTTEQVILTFNRPKEEVEAKISRLENALVEVTQARITITEVRVRQTDDGTVDIAGTDVIFFALDPVNGVVIDPSGIIRIIDENYNIVNDIFTECQIEQIRVHPQIATDAVIQIPTWLWVVIAVLIVLVLCMCCCFLLGCVVERRRSRRWKKQAAMGAHQSQTDQFSSQMTDFNNPYSNPLWVSPYDNDETSTEISGGTDMDRENPLYESQELTIEMFQDGGDDLDAMGSDEHLLHEKAPRLSGSTPYRFEKGGRKTKRHFDSEEDLLAQAVGDAEDIDSQTSYID